MSKNKNYTPKFEPKNATPHKTRSNHTRSSSSLKINRLLHRNIGSKEMKCMDKDKNVLKNQNNYYEFGENQQERCCKNLLHNKSTQKKRIGKNQENLKNKKIDKQNATTEYDLWKVEPHKKKTSRMLKLQLKKSEKSKQKVRNERKILNKKLEKDKVFQQLTPILISKKRFSQSDIKFRNKNKSASHASQCSNELLQKFPSELSSTKPRFDKFEFRTEKYIQLHNQLKKSAELENRFKTQASETERKKVKSAFKERVQKLNKQIDYYTRMNAKSEKALMKMQKIQKQEREKYQKQKIQYIEQIHKLAQQLQEQRPNLGHIYTYKQFDNQKLVPDQIILESSQYTSQLLRNKFEGINYVELRKEGQRIIQFYENLEEYENCTSEVKCHQENNLSIVSKKTNS